MNNDLWVRLDEKERKVLEHHISSYPVRLAALAEDLGLKVFKSPLATSISGLIQPSSDGNGYEIRLNKYETPERQRFTLAHEIAHYLLHKEDIKAGVVDSVMYRSALTSRKEAEANRMAADIVMPMDAVKRELGNLGNSVSLEVAQRMATIFKVSLPAMKVRLGLI